MRLFRLAFALFYDPFWFANLRRSWKQRRYWVTAASGKALTGRNVSLQLGPLTFKLYAQGPDTVGAPPSCRQAGGHSGGNHG